MTDPERDAFDVRPTGDEMLARVRSDVTGGRGRLRIYLGMAPGVGKTYRMLEEGRRRRERGTDIVVGFVEAHGRPHTLELLDGLEILPRQRIEYRGVVVEEMDLDAVLKRRPQVAVVDELAHTNAPFCKNKKRYQDVLELLEAGINVICAFNVQHLESGPIKSSTSIWRSKISSIASKRARSMRPTRLDGRWRIFSYRKSLRCCVKSPCGRSRKASIARLRPKPATAMPAAGRRRANA